VHLLELMVHILHLSLLQSHLLLELDDFVVYLGEGSLVELQVIVRHLGLFLDVFILQLLEVRAYLAEVIYDGKDLLLGCVKLVLEFAHSLSSLFLSLYLGVRM